MITIKPYLRTYSQNSTTGVVWVYFYINRQKVNFTTGVNCQVNNWISEEFRISANEPGAYDKNLIIENIIARINNVFVKYRLKDRKLTRDAFLRAYNRPDDYVNFFSFVDQTIRKHGFRTEKSTLDAHKSVIKKIKEYNPDLHFDDITPDWLDDYYSYLRKDLKNNENTAYKNLSTFKKYVRLAYKAGYMDENPFDNWRIKRGKANYTYLSEDELNKFVHAYTTGQFNGDSFTYYRVKNRNSKPEPIVVPVSESLRKIITNVVGTRKKGEIFEHMPAPQTMNDYLKVIAAELEVQDADKLYTKPGDIPLPLFI